jgi:uncharacterized protein (TIGR02246 family)
MKFGPAVLKTIIKGEGKMRNYIRVRNLLLVFASMTACALFAAAIVSAATNPGAEDEAAIRESVREMESGWNKKSGASFARHFADDADYVVINGMQIKGREAIAKSHQQIFETIFRESTLSLSVKQLRFLRPDVALVHISGRLQARQGDETREADATITLVMTKEKGEWKIAAFQNTGVEPPRRP